MPSRENKGKAMEDDDELGPLLVAPPPYLELRRLIRSALGFPDDRRPLLIGIDGVDGSGKSSVASWLSWQLEMPAVYLDLYLVRDSEPLAWRYDDLSRMLDAQIALQRPVIVEGVMLLRVLRKIGRVPDFPVCVEKDQHEGCLRDELRSYFAVEQPKEQAQFVLKWSDVDYLERMMQAHLRRRELDR
jgi:uridine kinase